MTTRLRAAPALASHLSAAQLGRLRRLLLEDRVIQQSRAVELQDPRDLEPDLAEVLLVRCREALGEIESALRLIDQSAYGLCSVCGTAIPYERLEAVPATRRCVSCQDEREERA